MLLNLISLISGFNFLMLSLVLFFKDSPFKLRNRYLAFCFLFSSIFEVAHTYFHYFIKHDIQFLKYYLPIEGLLTMLCGPLILFYTLSITTGRIRINLKTSIHLIPLLPYFILVVYIAQMSGVERVNYLVANFRSLNLASILNNIWFCLQITFYLSLSLNKLIKFKKQLTTEQNSKFSAETDWFKSYLILVLVLFILIAIITTIFNNKQLNIILAQIFMNTQFFYIFIKVLWSSHLFPSDTKGTFWGKDKYATSSLSQAQINNYYEKALNYLKTEKLFTDMEININKLSERIEIPVNYLSQAINTKNGSGFFDFINQLRIEEAKKLFRSADYCNYTIEAIGYECGFGTKTSFNRAFKKYTGKTPSEYRKK